MRSATRQLKRALRGARSFERLDRVWRESVARVPPEEECDLLRRRLAAVAHLTKRTSASPAKACGAWHRLVLSLERLIDQDEVSELRIAGLKALASATASDVEFSEKTREFVAKSEEESLIFVNSREDSKTDHVKLRKAVEAIKSGEITHDVVSDLGEACLFCEDSTKFGLLLSGFKHANETKKVRDMVDEYSSSAEQPTKKRLFLPLIFNSLVSTIHEDTLREDLMRMDVVLRDNDYEIDAVVKALKALKQIEDPMKSESECLKVGIAAKRWIYDHKTKKIREDSSVALDVYLSLLVKMYRRHRGVVNLSSAIYGEGLSAFKDFPNKKKSLRSFEEMMELEFLNGKKSDAIRLLGELQSLGLKPTNWTLKKLLRGIALSDSHSPYKFDTISALGEAIGHLVALCEMYNVQPDRVDLQMLHKSAIRLDAQSEVTMLAQLFRKDFSSHEEDWLPV